MAWLSDSLALKQVTPVYALGLFFVCMACHGELARLKPEPRRLTAFYLCMSVGGALGSLFMAVLAPLVFKGYFELYAALVVAGMAAWLLPLPAWASSRRLVLRSAVAAVVLCTGALSMQGVKTYVEAVRFMDRDFYGVVRTRDSDVGGEPFRNLIHGAIAHGGQLLREDLRMAPSGYFGPTSGYGRVFASLPPGPRKVGVIGLGAGALAAYAKPGDDWVFYEISPAVVQAALQEFTFLPKFPGRHEVVVGDGRLALEREAPRQYDVLAMDAFAGRLHPHPPDHARGHGGLPQAPQARRRAGVPGHQPLRQPDARAAQPGAGLRHAGRLDLGLPPRPQGLTTGCPPPTR